MEVYFTQQREGCRHKARIILMRLFFLPEQEQDNAKNMHIYAKKIAKKNSGTSLFGIQNRKVTGEGGIF